MSLVFPNFNNYFIFKDFTGRVLVERILILVEFQLRESIFAERIFENEKDLETSIT